jgi:hypothetical protein
MTLIHPPRVQEAMKKLNRDLFFKMLYHARLIKNAGFNKVERHCFYHGFYWGQHHSSLLIGQLHHAVAQAEARGEYHVRT